MCNIFTGWLRGKIKNRRVFREQEFEALKSYLQIVHINEGYLPGGMNGILHEPGRDCLRENRSVRPRGFPVCPQLPCAIFTVETESWDKVPNMTQLFFTSLEGVHEATLSIRISIPCIAVSAFHIFQVISGCWDGIDYEAKHSVFIIYNPDTALAEIWYRLNIMLLKDFILTAEANCFT